MCHISETEHHFDARKPLYEPAQPDQTRRYCRTPSEAKFWREAQERPTSWMIGYDKRQGYVVSRISHRS